MRVLLLSSLFCSYFYRRYLYGDFLAFCTWFLRDFCTGLIVRFYNKLFESCVETRIPRLEKILTVVIVLTAANVIGESVTSNHQVQKTTHQNKNSQYKFNKPQRQYINQLVEAAVKKTKHDSNVVESDEDDEWSKGKESTCMFLVQLKLTKGLTQPN
jgi:hypothetical protein